MHNIRLQAGLIAALALGGCDLTSRNVPNRWLVRNQCAQCHKKIPDGKPGRKCPECRGKP